MSHREAPDPDCAVRAHGGWDGVVRLQSRNHSYAAEGQTGYDPKSIHPSALDYLLGSLASDLLAGLDREATRAGIAFEAVELSLAGRLENPLIALGVVGETGSPRLAEVAGSLYVTSDATDTALRELWEQTLRKAPVYTTLVRAARIDISLKLVP